MRSRASRYSLSPACSSCLLLGAPARAACALPCRRQQVLPSQRIEPCAGSVKKAIRRSAAGAWDSGPLACASVLSPEPDCLRERGRDAHGVAVRRRLLSGVAALAI